MRRIRVPGVCFIKEHGEACSRDWQRLRSFTELVDQVPGLVTARPLWHDRGSGQIGYQWLDNLAPCWEVIDARWFASFGGLLAQLQQLKPRDLPADLLLCGAHPVDFPGVDHRDALLLTHATPQGWFHGDLWMGNVAACPSGEVALLDPIPSPWLFNTGHCIAPGALDAAMFHMSLYFSHPLWRTLRGMPLKLVDAGHAFLEGYLNELSAKSARPSMLRLSAALASRYVSLYSQRLRWPVATLKRLAAQRLSSKLKENLT